MKLNSTHPVQLLSEATRLARAALDQLPTLSASSLLGGLPPTPLAVQFVCCSLAGTNHHGGTHDWSISDELHLEPEPDNSYDAHAIQVFRNGSFSGYIAKKDASHLAKLLRNDGWNLTGKAFYTATDGGAWDEGTISVRLENPIMGWSEFNPAQPFQWNKARYEAELLARVAQQNALSAPSKALSL